MSKMADPHATNVGQIQNVKTRLDLVAIPDNVERLRRLVERGSEIRHRMWWLVRNHMEALYDDGEDLPDLTDTNTQYLREAAVVVLNRATPNARPLGALDDAVYNNNRESLVDFYDNTFKTLLGNDATLDLSLGPMHANFNNYLATELITHIRTNISEHLSKHVRRYIEAFVDTRALIEAMVEQPNLTVKTQKYRLRERIRTYTHKVMNGETLPPEIAQAFEDMWPDNMTRQVKVDGVETDEPISLSYMATMKSRSTELLPSMLRMQRFVVSRGYKPLVVFPMTNANGPVHITIDTQILKSMMDGDDVAVVARSLVSHGQKNPEEVATLRKSHMMANGGTELYGPHIWRLFFDTNQRCFAPRSKLWKFGGVVTTDGVSISIQHIDRGAPSKSRKRKTNNAEDDAERERRKVAAREKAEATRAAKKARVEAAKEQRAANALLRSIKPDMDPTPPDRNGEHYVTKEMLDGKRVVAIDPNKRDLLFCVQFEREEPDESGNMRPVDPIFWRYTSMRRRKDTGEKANRIIRLRMERRKINANGDTIESIKTALGAFPLIGESAQHLQTATLEHFKARRKMRSVFSKPIWRKLRFNRYVNGQRAEAVMLKEFESKFGGPDETVAAFGDSGDGAMRYQAPAKCRGFRDIFRRRGYIVGLVDEHRTSKGCMKCQSIGVSCTPYKTRQNPRPYKTNVVPVHGLLHCPQCQQRPHSNRDTQASVNIARICHAIRRGEPRPAYLRRTLLIIDDSPPVNAGGPAGA